MSNPILTALSQLQSAIEQQTDDLIDLSFGLPSPLFEKLKPATSDSRVMKIKLEGQVSIEVERLDPFKVWLELNQDVLRLMHSDLKYLGSTEIFLDERSQLRTFQAKSPSDLGKRN